MASESLFKLLSDFLIERIQVSVEKGYGSGDASPKKDKEAELCDLFEKYVCRCGEDNFLMSRTGVLHVYNGRHYEKIDTEAFLPQLIKIVLARLGVAKVYEKFSYRKIADECMQELEEIEAYVFEPDRRYIAFGNGIFDVKTGRLLPFSKKLRTDIVLDIDYDARAAMPLWYAKVAEILPNDDMRSAFQKFCGMLLINRDEIKIEYVCFLLGPGSNGKSVLASVVSAVFGDKYFAKFAPEQLLKDSNRMFNLASLDGMIANFTDDLNKSDISSKSFKSFASGQEFPARYPFGRRTFNVKAPLMLCCANDMPPTTDDSWGYHRRILPIYSTTRVMNEKDKDPRLVAKLSTAEARQTIFNWIYEGYKDIIANGGNIELGEAVREAQEALREDSNSARRWIRDSGLVAVYGRGKSDPAWRSLREWHSIYKEYCDKNGDKTPQNSKSLGKIFREKGFADEHRRDGMWFCIGTLGVDTDGGESKAAGAAESYEEEDLPF